MDFQLRQHEQYLRIFAKLFRRVDIDNDGILSEQEFLALLNEEILPLMQNKADDSYGAAFSDEDVSYFLQVLDPFNTQKITFSEVVQLFSAHLVSHRVVNPPAGLN